MGLGPEQKFPFLKHCDCFCCCYIYIFVNFSGNYTWILMKHEHMSCYGYSITWDNLVYLDGWYFWGPLVLGEGMHSTECHSSYILYILFKNIHHVSIILTINGVNILPWGPSKAISHLVILSFELGPMGSFPHCLAGIPTQDGNNLCNTL